MADKRYKVLSEKFTGKHKVYKKGDIIPESEVMGGEKGLELALKGQKDKKRGDLKLKDVPVKLKLVTKSEKAGK